MLFYISKQGIRMHAGSLIDAQVAHTQWINTVVQGIADAAVITEKAKVTCPDFGQPGWGPFCFLNGNPLFNAFDTFQAFIQSSVVQLHDIIQAQEIFHFHLHYELSNMNDLFRVWE